MPRQARTLSSTGTYHIMLRGNEQKNLFLDDDDRMYFIDTLLEKKKGQDWSIYAFCLMSNHVHLLMCVANSELSRIMKQINSRYAYYFNHKYGRIGHVFQDRFRSENVDAENYLLAVARYIHNNPVKAAMVKEPGDYRWSSYRAYTSKPDISNGLLDRQLILELFSSNRDQAIKQFIDFTEEEDEKSYLEMVEEKAKEIRTLKEAEAFLIKYLQQRQRNKGQLSEDKDLRQEIIIELKSRSMLSVRQIADLLDVSRSVVQRVKA